MPTGQFIAYIFGNSVDVVLLAKPFVEMKSEKPIDQYRPFWEKACEEFLSRLTLSAHRLTNNRIYDAEDLVQETICRALSYNRNPKEISNTLSYLLRMMRNVWIDKWVKENTARTESLDDALSAGIHPVIEPTIIRTLENEELQNKIQSRQVGLTHRERLLLTMYVNGYTAKEIAEKLNEDVRLTRSDLNALIAKVRYRLKRN